MIHNDLKEIVLKEVVVKSLQKLCKKDSMLIDSKVKEECINHKLAQYIERFTKEMLPELSAANVDVEYNKYKVDPKKMMGQKPIRPDVLVHRRQSGKSDNYLVVEAKKGYSSKHDRKKIKFLVSDAEYLYLLGCLISYQPAKYYLILEFWQSEPSKWEKIRYRKSPFEKYDVL